MEQSEQNTVNMESEPTIEIIFDYSIQSEINRLKWTLNMYKWYKENGYKVKLPELILEKIENGEEITEDNIYEVVSSEFNGDIYSREIEKMENEWNEMKDKFLNDLKTLGLPIQNKYLVFFTTYGSGGSYHTPNIVEVNLMRKKSAYLTIAHEIVHLTIQSLIIKYNIDQLTKERIVDLIINIFFPDNKRFQMDPKNAKQIGEIFEREFPDIEKIILEASKI